MGVPGHVLTDNMKSVVLHRDSEGHPVWNHDYEAFMNTIGFETKTVQTQTSVHERFLLSAWYAL